MKKKRKSGKGKEYLEYFGLSLGFGLLIGGLYYVILSDLIVTAIAGGASFIFLFGFVCPFLDKKKKRREVERDDYRFINAFAVSLSATSSLEHAYESGISSSSETLKDLSKTIEERKIEDRLSYLGTYFNSDTYSMFLSLFNLYQDQGGDFLKISSPLLGESSRTEESRIERDKVGKRYNREFLSLWGMAIAMVFFLRFALTGFYDQLIVSENYRLVSFCLLPVIFVSFFLFYKSVTGERFLKRRVKNESK